MNQQEPQEVQHPHWGWNNTMHQYRLGNDLTGWSFAEEKFRFLVNDRFNVSQHCTLATVKVNCVPGCISKTVVRRSSEVIISLCLALVRPLLEYCVHFWALRYKRDWQTGDIAGGRHGIKETGLHDSRIKMTTKCQRCDTTSKASNRDVFPLR